MFPLPVLLGNGLLITPHNEEARRGESAAAGLVELFWEVLRFASCEKILRGLVKRKA